MPNENYFFCIKLIFGVQSSPKNCSKNSTKILAFFMRFRIRALLLPCFALPQWAGRRHKGNDSTATVLQAMAETGQQEDARRRLYAL